MSDRPSFSDRLNISIGLVQASSAILLKNRSLLLFPFDFDDRGTARLGIICMAVRRHAAH